MADKANWNAICEQLCPGDLSLSQDVELSILDPSAYLKKFDDTLWERGIEDPSRIHPWLAMVDGLASRGYLREFDWKLEPNEIAFQLERLRPCKERNVQLSALRNNGGTGEELLEMAAAELHASSLSLLYLEIDGDCYPITIVPTDRVSEVVRLSQTLKHIIKVYGEKI